MTLKVVLSKLDKLLFHKIDASNKKVNFGGMPKLEKKLFSAQCLLDTRNILIFSTTQEYETKKVPCRARVSGQK